MRTIRFNGGLEGRLSAQGGCTSHCMLGYRMTDKTCKKKNLHAASFAGGKNEKKLIKDSFSGWTVFFWLSFEDIVLNRIHKNYRRVANLHGLVLKQLIHSNKFLSSKPTLVQFKKEIT